jgi:hypothetical protein
MTLEANDRQHNDTQNNYSRDGCCDAVNVEFSSAIFSVVMLSVRALKLRRQS